MTTPNCPQDYSCTFTLTHPRVVVHQIGPWWHTWMLPAVIIIVAIGILVTTFYVVELISNHMKDNRNNRLAFEREREIRKHDEFMAEQRTMQMEQAHGDPKMLEIVQDWNRR